jgi:hypothetical protein
MSEVFEFKTGFDQGGPFTVSIDVLNILLLFVLCCSQASADKYCVFEFTLAATWLVVQIWHGFVSERVITSHNDFRYPVVRAWLTFILVHQIYGQTMWGHIRKKRGVIVMFLFLIAMAANFYMLTYSQHFVYYLCAMYLLSTMSAFGDCNWKLGFIAGCQALATFFAWIPDDEMTPGYATFDRMLTSAAIVTYYATVFSPLLLVSAPQPADPEDPTVTLGEVVGMQTYPAEEAVGLPIYEEEHLPPPYPPPAPPCHPVPSAPTPLGGNYGTDPLYTDMGSRSNQREEKIPY